MKSDRESEIYDITSLWTLKKMIQMNLLPKQKQTYTNIENKLRVTKGERGGGIKQEVGINIHTLLYIK